LTNIGISVQWQKRVFLPLIPDGAYLAQSAIQSVFSSGANIAVGVGSRSLGLWMSQTTCLLWRWQSSAAAPGATIRDLPSEA